MKMYIALLPIVLILAGNSTATYAESRIDTLNRFLCQFNSSVHNVYFSDAQLKDGTYSQRFEQGNGVIKILSEATLCNIRRARGAFDTTKGDKIEGLNALNHLCQENSARLAQGALPLQVGIVAVAAVLVVGSVVCAAVVHTIKNKKKHTNSALPIEEHSKKLL